MEVALSGPPRRGTPLPLSPLLEESRASVPNHLLQSKIYAKLKSNGLIQAEPPELHFSGFELQKDYVKTLELINISSEAMNIHIIPTQTTHFQTSYTKKCRLIPGLAYTLKLVFRPDEWRYFYDCIRVHCKGEENLLVPVHGYPVIDDLRVPPRIDLPATPLRQSVRHAIPLRCSCPVDFEFQVYVIEPHEAFTVHPLSGVIPANGEVKIIVTFSPSQYETSQVTIQLVISQFNTRPYVCTITGSSAPHLALSELRRTWAHEEAPDAPRPPPASKVRPRSKTKVKSKVCVEPGPKPPVDVWTPAGVAKMLIQDLNKLSAKELKEDASCGSTGLQDRQTKEAIFLKKVQQNIKEEQDNHIRWQVHLGKDPVSQRTRREVAEEREIALHQYTVKTGGLRHGEKFAPGPPRLSSQRMLCEAGQACEGTPSFQFHTSFQWELRRRALVLFQQAARKVVIRCRMNRRLSRLKRRSDSMKNSAQKDEDETTRVPNVPPDRVLQFAFPVFPDDNPLAPSNLEPVFMDPTDATVTTIIPFFKLQVPQHYKLMGYQPLSAWEAFDSYIPTALARPLRTGALPKDELPSNEDAGEDEDAVNLTFSAPEALLRPPPANPLRIFNPAPGLQVYKPTPKYLESDLEFHLCPLPRGTIHKNHTQKKFPDRKEVIAGLMKWREFDSITSDCLSKQPAVTMAGPRCIDYSTDTLPPPPDDLTPLKDKQCEGSGVTLTPEMIRAQFLSPVSNSNLSRGATARHQKPMEINQMGKRVTTKLKQLAVADVTSLTVAETDPPQHTHSL